MLKTLYAQVVLTHKVHVEIFQFNFLFSNSKMRAPVLSTCTAQFCRPRAFVLLVGT